ncbi:MAG: hypothetical protein J5852_03440 [Clostridia bacterium]|nr:hypothetical protein [Clostridia bacterium]
MKRVILVLFILIPSLITAAIFALPDNVISEKENRSLVTKSDISQNIKDGSFQSDIENYLSDQFPLREGLVYARNCLYYAAGRREIGGAYLCRDGRLIQKITDADIDKDALISYADKISEIAEDHKVFVMYVPSASAVGKDELPAGAPTYDYESLYAELTARLYNAKCIDLSKRLGIADYYKTDHHFNTHGAYKAYAAFCEAKGEAAKREDDFKLKSADAGFRGTLYSKVLISKTKDEILLPDISLPQVTADGKEIPFYDYTALKTKDKYNVYQGGNHGITEIKGNGKNGKTLLIFKDSFANSFVPFIVNDYAKIILVDERYTFLSAKDFAEQNKPDEILVLREIIN